MNTEQALSWAIENKELITAFLGAVGAIFATLYNIYTKLQATRTALSTATTNIERGRILSKAAEEVRQDIELAEASLTPKQIAALKAAVAIAKDRTIDLKNRTKAQRAQVPTVRDRNEIPGGGQ